MRLHNPELLSLSRIEWQFFCTFSFKSERLTDGIRLSIFFALLRTQARNFGVHFKQLVWALRRESGESTGRLHFHALIAGLPPSGRTAATSFSTMRLWERLGGGMARVTVYNPTLDGVDYILKRGDELAGSLATRYAGDYHETQKFGGSCDVMLSESVFKVLEGRRSIGQRRHPASGQAE